jgi:methylmalonyl-CoA epimerase
VTQVVSGKLRRLDHIGIVVRSTADALAYFQAQLGLAVTRSEELDEPRVRLTYLDAGNAFIQLVEPLDDQSPIAKTLKANGEGIHHICFGVDDVREALDWLTDGNGEMISLGRGRSRESAFVPGSEAHGVRLELTQFRHDEDVRASPGWLE